MATRLESLAEFARTASLLQVDAESLRTRVMERLGRLGVAFGHGQGQVLNELVNGFGQVFPYPPGEVGNLRIRGARPGTTKSTSPPLLIGEVLGRPSLILGQVIDLPRVRSFLAPAMTQTTTIPPAPEVVSQRKGNVVSNNGTSLQVPALYAILGAADSNGKISRREFAARLG